MGGGAGFNQIQPIMETAQPDRLVLHFDVNKTLVMTDPAGSKTLEDTINDILSETCYGTIEQHPTLEKCNFIKLMASSFLPNLSSL